MSLLRWIAISLCTVWFTAAVDESAAGMGEKVATPSGQMPITLAPVVTSGLSRPVFVTHAGDGSGRLFVVEQPGRIRIVKDGALLNRPYLDVVDRVTSGGERGLLGLAFHPGYRENRRFFVNYSRARDGATVVAEYRVSRDADVALDAERIILVVEQPYGNHNGGMVAFGPDQHLYIGMGDGGSGGDPENRGQDNQELLGKMLRIDVDRGNPYAVPSDNPYVRGGGRPEIFATGFRNPWRFSFDRETDLLWAADVGQNAWEEVDVVQLGGNYGWRIMEGTHCYSPPRGCRTRGLELPVAQYANRGSRCAVTGGYVYRGKTIPALRGTYLFADYCSGEIFGFRPGESRSGVTTAETEILLSSGLRISSFGEDRAGEVYVVAHGGAVYRITGGGNREES